MGLFEFAAGLGLANRMRAERLLVDAEQCENQTLSRLDYYERMMEQQERTHESVMYQKNIQVETLQQAVERLSALRDLHVEHLQQEIRRLFLLLVVFSVIGESLLKECW